MNWQIQRELQWRPPTKRSGFQTMKYLSRHPECQH